MTDGPRRDLLREAIDGLGIDAVGLVVVDHGSRRPEANRSHEEFVRAWPARGAVRTVQAAHMELSEPSLATAFDACVAAGATTVVIAPYFLGPGQHWDTRHPGPGRGGRRPPSGGPLPGGRPARSPSPAG